MLLEAKNAAVFAASGAIASQVARRLAAEGAIVWLSARRGYAATELAKEITEAGGLAHAHELDARDPEAVDSYFKTIATAAQIDIVFNGIGGPPAELGYPARSLDQDVDTFLLPMRTIVGSQFLTAREAAKHMASRPTGTSTGSIVMISAALAALHSPQMAGISAACGAIEAMTRSLAAEFGPSGIRVNCVRASAMPETRTIRETMAAGTALGERPAARTNVLGRPLSVSDTAGAVAFLASSLSSGVSGQVLAL
jgi:3-oxoacyl-[acyl-carrier protein] reductase